MKIATARSKTSKSWRTKEITWEQFLDSLRTPMRTGETMREYKNMTKAERDQAKEVAGGFVGGSLEGGQRKTEFVRDRWLITLDADDAVPGQWNTVIALHDFRMCCYPTHSSTPEKPRLRWVIPTARAMTPDEYPAVARKVAEWIGMDTMDSTTFALARLFFYPSVPSDAPYELKEQDGEILSPDYVLSFYGPGESWKDSTLWPIAKSENEIRLRGARKAEDPTTKDSLVGLFCRAFDIHDVIEQFLPGVYTESNHPDRYTFTGGSTFAGAIVYDDGRFLYSNHATDPCQGRSVNAFDLVRIHKFGHLDDDAREGTPVSRLPSTLAMNEFALSQPEVQQLKAVEEQESVQRDFEDMLAVEANDGKGWEKLIKRDSKGRPEITIENARTYLKYHPAFKDSLGYNPMSDTITVKGNLPWWNSKTRPQLADILGKGKGSAKRRNIWGEGDWPNFYAFFEKLGFPATGTSQKILNNALQIVSQENTYHPIQSYLQELEWDGTPRLETMFIRWLGAEDDRLNREITKLWMIAAVDRVMRPGCQFDSVIILKGPQGSGKSRMLKMLSRGFFTNSMDKLTLSKDVGEKLQGVWIAELGELDGLRKSEITATKNFITATTDRYRGAYRREAVDHPRQCVFAGTTNEGSFLRDATGERRWWIMPIQGTGDRGELDGFRAEIDQLWAEAYRYWVERLEGMSSPGQDYEEVELKLYLKDPELDKQMKQRQAGVKMAEDDRDEVADYLDRPRPKNWYDLEPYERRNFIRGDWIGDLTKCTLQIDRVSVKELRCEVFGERLEDTGSKNSRSYRLNTIMDTMPGWERLELKQRVKGYPGAKSTTWERIKNEKE